MSRLRGLFMRLAGSFGGSRRDRELAEELKTHIEMHVEDGVRSGLTEEDARRRGGGAARRRRADAGAVARPARLPVDPGAPTGPALRGAHAAPQPRLHGRHRSDARPRHRRRDRDLHGRPRRPPLGASLPRRGPARRGLGGERRSAGALQRRRPRQFHPLGRTADRVLRHDGAVRLACQPDRSVAARRARRAERDLELLHDTRRRAGPRPRLPARGGPRRPRRLRRPGIRNAGSGCSAPTRPWSAGRSS